MKDFTRVAQFRYCGADCKTVYLFNLNGFLIGHLYMYHDDDTYQHDF